MATISLQNEDRGNLIISVLTPDSIGQMEVIAESYTSLRNIHFAVRGYGPERRAFGVCLRDRWDNLTDTIYQELIPWEEHELDKANFREVVLETDIRLNAWGFSMAHIWNNEYGWGLNDMCHSEDFPAYPVWFTFDLGVTA
ncbi:MAG: DUF5126 domain-containing protein [Bacteroides sp.]|nr:DUF5126 domain-containing protein [Bacteroides sp.]